MAAATPPPPHADYHWNIVPGEPDPQSGHIDFFVPQRREFNFAAPSSVSWYGSTNPLNFNGACYAAAGILKFVFPDGTPNPSAFLLFSAAFAAMNPELWKQFEKADLASGKKGGGAGRIEIWERLADDLEDAANKHGGGLSSHTGVRGAAVWLLKRLSLFRSEQNSSSNTLNARFFTRFTEGRNRREAETEPKLHDIWDRTIASGLAYEGQQGPLSAEDLAFLEDGVREDFDRTYWEWQFERAKLLRWPGLPPRKTKFRYYMPLWGDEPETHEEVPSQPVKYPRVIKRKTAFKNRKRKVSFPPKFLKPSVRWPALKSNHNPALNVLPDEAQKALQSPYEGILYYLVPAEKGSSSGKILHGCSILARVPLNRKQKQKIAGALHQAVGEWEYFITGLFDPLFNLQILWEGHIYEFLFAPFGHRMLILKDDKVLANLGATKSPDDFVTLCTSVGVILPGLWGVRTRDTSKLRLPTIHDRPGEPFPTFV